jgi:hypothetical protein
MELYARRNLVSGIWVSLSLHPSTMGLCSRIRNKFTHIRCRGCSRDSWQGKTTRIIVGGVGVPWGFGWIDSKIPSGTPKLFLRNAPRTTCPAPILAFQYDSVETLTGKRTPPLMPSHGTPIISWCILLFAWSILSFREGQFRG